MDDRHERGPKRRRLTAVSLVAAGALIAAPGVANAEPSASEVRQKIERLEREFSELAEKYNEAKEDHDTTKKKLKDVKDDLKKSEKGLKGLRKQVGGMANAAYSGTDYSAPSYLMGSGGPEDTLRQAADLGYLSSNQTENLSKYTEEKDRLEKLEKEYEDTEEKAKKKLKDANKAKKQGEQKVEKQQQILDDLTTSEQDSATSNVGDGRGGSSSGGSSYNGPATGNAKAALDFAYAQVGKPYVWGGTGPDGFDCSGLTQAAWKKGGVNLPRTSQSQYGAGQRVSFNELQPGDLLFFYSSSPSHVGIYAGNNKMVHASTSSKPVMEVSLNSYYKQEFVGGIRP
ncbi:C40 family peptidase [Murinocardiopsis flavida]|uniref:C40 family peptidase n=1 Tax=Murinocardiopsis flavida TaxID=645275 RepID=UPI001FE8967F|nr:C40 family peptidase [Murinocardiopsis flavida]